MSVLSTPSRDAPVRTAMPWSRMLWVSWRKHRGAFIGLHLLFLPLGLAMVVMGEAARSLPAGQFQYHLYALARQSSFITLAAHLIPGATGMFLGAPVLAREYEHRTLIFAWTQGISRASWVTTTLLLLGVAVCLPTAALGALDGWMMYPFDHLGAASPWNAGQFDLTVITLPAWALAGFALGVFAGALTRSTVPAMALSAVVATIMAGLAWGSGDAALLTVGSVVGHGSPAALGTAFLAGRATPGPHGSWVSAQWFAAGGSRVSVLHVMRQIAPQADSAPAYPTPAQVASWSAQHHATLWWALQPASRYWLFQAADGMGLLLLAIALAGATRWLTRRRVP